jgi:hypothetical protein
MELGFKAKAISVYPSGNGGHISAMLNAWAFKYNLIRDLTVSSKRWFIVTRCFIRVIKCQI